MHKIKIIGHRGAVGYEPENTLRSISKAMALGADMIEVDILVLPSGQIILMHDDRVDRTTNGQGLTLDISFDELRKLDAGKGERIPTLQEAIDLIDSRVPLVVELKNPGSAQPVAQLLQQYLNQGWKADRFIVSSFNHPELRAFKTLLPSVNTAALLYSIPLDYAGCCIPLGANIVAPATDIITPEFVVDAHQRGLLLYAWVWQPVYEEETRRLYAMGVDGIYTDFVDKTRETITGRMRTMPNARDLIVQY
jgi:glycerophosphoryl diester phosphodiesterase